MFDSRRIPPRPRSNSFARRKLAEQPLPFSPPSLMSSRSAVPARAMQFLNGEQNTRGNNSSLFYSLINRRNAIKETFCKPTFCPRLKRKNRFSLPLFFFYRRTLSEVHLICSYISVHRCTGQDLCRSLNFSIALLRAVAAGASDNRDQRSSRSNTVIYIPGLHSKRNNLVM